MFFLLNKKKAHSKERRRIEDEIYRRLLFALNIFPVLSKKAITVKANNDTAATMRPIKVDL